MKEPTSPARVAPPDRIRFGLSGRSVLLDARIHAARGDVADISLAGMHFSAHYARAIRLTCVASGMPVRSGPALTSGAISELLRGETFHALDVTTDWAWGFCGHDGYVGYVPREGLGMLEAASHQVVAHDTPLFSAPDIKSPILDHWPAGAHFQATGEEGMFVACAQGYVHTRHCDAIDVVESDWVAVAERYMGQSYIWGGRGHRGVDCSGLVQVALGQCGIPVPRDTDLQREGVGRPLDADVPLRRGDILFFPGHVGIMADDRRLLHANAHWMAVVTEPLTDVVARLTPNHADSIVARRRIGE